MGRRTAFVDPDLIFDAGSHTYHHLRWPLTRLQSVTSYVEQFTRFDATAAATRRAASRGEKVSDVFGDWNARGHLARTGGTAAHAYAEYLALRPHALPPPPAGGHALAIWRFFRDHQGDLAYGWCLPEVRIASRRLRLAGTVDLICRFRGVPAILDFKTSISITAFAADRMLPPWDHLPDCNLSHYRLQLTTYADILTEHSYRVRFMAIVWLGSGGTYKIVPCLSAHKKQPPRGQ